MCWEWNVVYLCERILFTEPSPERETTLIWLMQAYENGSDCLCKQNISRAKLAVWEEDPHFWCKYSAVVSPRHVSIAHVYCYKWANNQKGCRGWGKEHGWSWQQIFKAKKDFVLACSYFCRANFTINIFCF